MSWMKSNMRIAIRGKYALVLYICSRKSMACFVRIFWSNRSVLLRSYSILLYSLQILLTYRKQELPKGLPKLTRYYLSLHLLGLFQSIIGSCGEMSKAYNGLVLMSSVWSTGRMSIFSWWMLPATPCVSCVTRPRNVPTDSLRSFFVKAYGNR